MFEHNDTLEGLNQHSSLREKITCAHQSLNELFPFIVRIAIAIYDSETNLLKTYLHSSEDDSPLEHYQALMDDAPMLKEILKQGKPRVINNLVTFENSKSEHTRRIGRSGYAASYTMPMFNDGVFIGFIFFNSKETDVFNEQTLREIDLYGHLISLMVINEMSSIHTLSAAVRTTGSMTHLRDPETGSHLDRMSRYSRIIAMDLANKYELDDLYIEHIFMFAPLHDIGKIATPDEILMKPGKLNPDETVIMNNHAPNGRKMIDELVDNFGLENVEHIDMLRNIAEYHHESVNGKGYPEGKAGDDIPLEARIIAVADVFDALTSQRPYKEAWSNERAIKMLKKLSGKKLDNDCVEALLRNMDKVEVIQQQFQENTYG